MKITGQYGHSGKDLANRHFNKPATFQGIIVKHLRKILGSKSGATAIEYGLLAALIAVVIIGGATRVGQNTRTAFNTVSNATGSAS